MHDDTRTFVLQGVINNQKKRIKRLHVNPPHHMLYESMHRASDLDALALLILWIHLTIAVAMCNYEQQ